MLLVHLERPSTDLLPNLSGGFYSHGPADPQVNLVFIPVSPKMHPTRPLPLDQRYPLREDEFPGTAASRAQSEDLRGHEELGDWDAIPHRHRACSRYNPPPLFLWRTAE